MSGFDVICCVVNDGNGTKALHIAKKHGVRGGTITVGRGTVKSHILELLGLSEKRKEVVYMLAERELASAAMRGIGEEMEFHKDHHGIAFSYHVAEFIGRRDIYSEEDNEGERPEGKKAMYNVIYAIVEKGKAEDVIDAATEVGARGGTIMNARGAGPHEVQKVFAVDIEPEKEIVFIIARSDFKDAIVESIRNHLEIGDPGHGVIFVLDIAELYGLKHD